MIRRRTLARLFAATLVAGAGTLGTSACAGDKILPLEPVDTIPKAITVSFTGGTVKSEIASTFATRETGLSNRTSIAADSGMLFIWANTSDPILRPFWMNNTHFDLAIAFLDVNKVVINIVEMTKDTQTNHYATAPFRYALEAPKGWFAAHGVVPGATASFALPAGTVIDP